MDVTSFLTHFPSQLSFRISEKKNRLIYNYSASLHYENSDLKRIMWLNGTQSLIYNYSASLHYENSDLKRIMWLNGTQSFVSHIPCDRLIIKYFIQQTAHFIQQTAQSVVNKHLSLRFILHISVYERSSLGRYIQRHTNTANSVKGVCVFV
jgi:hypothetical protein